MKILHRYILQQLIRNLALCSLMFTCLFLFVDFFDRIDNVLDGDGSFSNIISYFGLKIPYMFTLTLPISMLVSVLFSIGLMTKSSELTAMRAAGLRLVWMAAPVFVVGAVVSLLSFILNETIVPYSQRRVREIYNIDIKQRDKTGQFSRDSFWFRHGDEFYSVSMFDSRNDSLLGLSIYTLSEAATVRKYMTADKAYWMGESLGWTMQDVVEKTFSEEGQTAEESFSSLPLIIEELPEQFYTKRTDPNTMSFQELRKFIQQQDENGLSTKSYLGDLYAKLSFPFINLILPLLVVPLAVGSGRTKSLAGAAIAAVITGFSYHVVHSLSIALARAELWPPLLSAWAANILLGMIGAVLFLGAEAPE